MTSTAKNYDTIDLEYLNALPEYGGPYRVDRSEGSGCAGDPPGYPSYFLKNIWTGRGDHPQSGPTMVIYSPTTDSCHVVLSADEDYEVLKKRMQRMYKKLPIDHPRVKAWISSTFTHHHSCYLDREGKLPKTLTRDPRWPIFIWSEERLSLPYYDLRLFVDDARFSQEWREKEQAAVKQHNDELNGIARSLATVDNHSAVVLVRRHYPDFDPTTYVVYAKHRSLHEPRVDLIKTPLKYNAGDWMERHDHQPKDAEECTRMMTPWLKEHSGGHRDGWCQFCGRTGDGVEELVV